MTEDDDAAVREYKQDQWHQLEASLKDPARDIARQWREAILALIALAVGALALLPQLLGQASRQTLAAALLVSVAALVCFAVSHWYAGKSAYGTLGTPTRDSFMEDYEGSLQTFKMARHRRARSDLRWAKASGLLGICLAFGSYGIGILALMSDTEPMVKVSACFDRADIADVSKVIIRRPPDTQKELSLDIDELTLERC